MKQFFGREMQVKQLRTFLRSPSQSAALVYGRRRIGKTELIKHCFSESAAVCIYYECKETSEANNTQSLAEIISEQLGIPPVSFSRFEQLLAFLYKYPFDRELALAIDEYQYLRRVVTGLDSIIQSAIDNRGTSNVHLILCGSYVDTMKSLLEKQNPLYGRFDLIIDLKAMDYYDSALFYPTFSAEDKVRLYSVFGGVPYYNRLIDENKTVKENIIDLIASPGSRFETEVPMALKSEIQKMTNAYEVFETLSKGYVRFADILSQSQVSSSPTLVDVLDKLCKMDVVKKEAPINDENNKKKAGYYISDPFTRFYFTYIYRNSSRLNVMDSDIFFLRYIEQDFEEHYVPHLFEEVCRQFLIRKNRRAELENCFERIGTYYYDDAKNHKNGEFDIVTENEGEYIFYEAKFKKEPLTLEKIQEEIAQVQATGFVCRTYGFFSRSGFTGIRKSDKENLILYELKDLF